MIDFLEVGSKVIPEVVVDDNTWKEELYQLVKEELAAQAEGKPNA